MDSLFPVLEPVIVGWSGGPPARLLAAKGPDGVRDVAFRELASHIGWSRRRLAGMVREVLFHDWQADPFSRGAYSYALVGGADAAKALARPIERTLFFAGEAADPQGRNGTVEGAIGSGRRAAAGVTAASGRAPLP